MSIDAINEAYKLPLAASEKAVLLCLANHANLSHMAWPSIETIIFNTSLSRATVYRALKSLYNSKLVTWQWCSKNKSAKYKLELFSPTWVAWVESGEKHFNNLVNKAPSKSHGETKTTVNKGPIKDKSIKKKSHYETTQSHYETGKSHYETNVSHHEPPILEPLITTKEPPIEPAQGLVEPLPDDSVTEKTKPLPGWNVANLTKHLAINLTSKMPLNELPELKPEPVTLYVSGSMGSYEGYTVVEAAQGVAPKIADNCNIVPPAKIPNKNGLEDPTATEVANCLDTPAVVALFKAGLSNHGKYLDTNKYLDFINAEADHMKLDDVLKDAVVSVTHTLSNCVAQANGVYTAAALSTLWCRLKMAFYVKEWAAPLSGKSRAIIYKCQDKLPGGVDIKLVIYDVISRWGDYVEYLRVYTDIKQAPATPYLPFFIKYFPGAVNFHLTKTDYQQSKVTNPAATYLTNAIKKVDPIPVLLGEEQVPPINPHQVEDDSFDMATFLKTTSKGKSK